MFRAFRIISLLEGLSYLAILSVTLGVLSRDFVSVLGMAHGVLFMLYLLLSLTVSSKRGWSLIVWLGLFLASLVPFAFIGIEVFLRKQAEKNRRVDRVRSALLIPSAAPHKSLKM